MLLGVAAMDGYVASLDALTRYAEKKREKLIEALCRNGPVFSAWIEAEIGNGFVLQSRNVVDAHDVGVLSRLSSCSAKNWRLLSFVRYERRP